MVLNDFVIAFGAIRACNSQGIHAVPYLAVALIQIGIFEAVLDENISTLRAAARAIEHGRIVVSSRADYSCLIVLLRLVRRSRCQIVEANGVIAMEGLERNPTNFDLNLDLTLKGKPQRSRVVGCQYALWRFGIAGEREDDDGKKNRLITHQESSCPVTFRLIRTRRMELSVSPK